MKIFSWLLIFAGLVALGIGVYFMFFSSNEVVTVEPKYKKISGTDICYNENCLVKQKNYYRLVYHTNIEEIDKVVNMINRQTLNYFHKYENSTSCDEMNSIYRYQYMMATDYYVFSNNRFVSIAIQRSKVDLCDLSENTKPMQVWIYDLKWKKFIDNSEFKDVLNISSNKIKKSVIKNMKIQHELSLLYDGKVDYKINKNDSLYYDSNGNLYMSYYDKYINSYGRALVLEN